MTGKIKYEGGIYEGELKIDAVSSKLIPHGEGTLYSWKCFCACVFSHQRPYSDRDFIVHRQTVRKSDRTLNRKTTLAATSRLLMRPADKLLRTAGKLRLPSGAIYHGEWQLGLRHGDGAPCSSCCINSCSPATRGRENSILMCIWLSRANPADSQSRRALPPYLLQACLQGNQRTSAATSTTATGAWTFAAAMVTRPHWDPFRRLKS